MAQGDVELCLTSRSLAFPASTHASADEVSQEESGLSLEMIRQFLPSSHSWNGKGTMIGNQGSTSRVPWIREDSRRNLAFLAGVAGALWQRHCC